MELPTIPLERVFFFIAGVVPGFVALLIYNLSAPHSFRWFFASSLIGYNTKVVIVLVVTLVIGNSLTSFFSIVANMVGGAVGGYLGKRPYKASSGEDVVPWRDAKWRSVARKQLGENAPNDTYPMSQAIYDQRVELTRLLPEEQQQQALLELALEKGNATIDDIRWEGWYDHYHILVLNPEHVSVELYIKNGFSANMQATAFCVLISATVVTELRRWWCIVPSLLWILIGAAQIVVDCIRLTNRWSTLSDQVTYLSRMDAP